MKKFHDTLSAVKKNIYKIYFLVLFSVPLFSFASVDLSSFLQQNLQAPSNCFNGVLSDSECKKFKTLDASTQQKIIDDYTARTVSNSQTAQTQTNQQTTPQQNSALTPLTSANSSQALSPFGFGSGSNGTSNPLASLFSSITGGGGGGGNQSSNSNPFSQLLGGSTRQASNQPYTPQPGTLQSTPDSQTPGTQSTPDTSAVQIDPNNPTPYGNGPLLGNVKQIGQTFIPKDLGMNVESLGQAPRDKRVNSACTALTDKAPLGKCPTKDGIEWTRSANNGDAICPQRIGASDPMPDKFKGQEAQIKQQDGIKQDNAQMKIMRQTLLEACKKIGKPIKARNVWRPNWCNRGAANSTHIQGNSIDMELVGYTKTEREIILQTFRKNGFSGSGCYNNPDYIHLAQNSGESYCKNGLGNCNRTPKTCPPEIGLACYQINSQ